VPLLVTLGIRVGLSVGGVVGICDSNGVEFVRCLRFVVVVGGKSFRSCDSEGRGIALCLPETALLTVLALFRTLATSAPLEDEMLCVLSRLLSICDSF
jgi:hypothetical protein